jgi:hypothetical protein
MTESEEYQVPQQVTEIPQLEGATFRAFRGAADYAELARIITAHSKGEGDDRVETAEGIASGYDHLENCDPARDLVVVEVDGQAVGYTRVFWEQEVDAASARRSSSGTWLVYARSQPSTTTALSRSWRRG